MSTKIDPVTVPSAATPPPLSDEDRAYLATYDPRGFPPVAVTVDIVILTIQPAGAVGTGGIVGRGLVGGLQKLRFLPEPHTDFI